MFYGSHVIEEFRKLAIARLMPDTCNIVPNSVEGTINALGYREFTEPTARTYNGSTDIPCRFDSVTSYRPDKATVQVVDVDEYMVVLPYDVTIELGDKLHFNGDVFEIRQLTQGDSQLEGVTEIRVHRVGFNNYQG